jgi:hypothetical protein
MPTRSSSKCAGSVPLVECDEQTGEWRVGSEALAIINGVQGDRVGVVAIAGRFRSGKSYLLNSIVSSGTKEKCGSFPIGDTVVAQTKGIWLCKKVLTGTDEQRTPILVIDTEVRPASPPAG